MKSRVLLFAAASAAALAAPHAFAQTAPASPAVGANEVQELVVTGTRAQPRSALESLSPVDVVSATNLQRQGATELGAQLAVSVPSIDFPRPSNTDATDSIRPATLRGQGPDQTLVLVNGVRAHTSAVVNLNGSVGRGSAAVDLNTIPTVAIDHIEVLRDGASALYGSDAIAGVLAIKLKERDSGGGASVTVGQFDTSFDGFVGGKRNIHDGTTVTVDGWQGFKLGDDGFVTVSAEFLHRDHTNRSDKDPRFPALGITSRFGDPDVHQKTAYINAGKPLGDGWELYGWAGGQLRQSESAATFRIPTDTTRNIASVYPNGFVPHIHTHNYDYTFGSQLKGDIAGWKSTFSADYGWNQIRYDTVNTINVSLGAGSPHQFRAGKQIYGQLVGNADFSKDFDVGMAGPLNVAFGLEARDERYKIGAGEPGSYIKGPFPGGVGAQGFPGFQPDNVVDVTRSNVGGYVALEGKVLPPLTLSGALREEHYSDFGNNTSGKVSFRYEVADWLAFRGSAESGFRAPSLQQEFFTSTASLFINGVQFDTGTFPATSSVAQALGGKALKPEKSKNYSLGAVIRTGALAITIDGYQIDVKDRIVLSENFPCDSSPDGQVICSLIAPFGANAARFFINGVDTRTRGLDVVATYRLDTQPWGDLALTASGNMNDFLITKVPASEPGLLPQPLVLFARQAALRFERGTPKYKASVQADWSLGPWAATARTTYYGDVLSPGTRNDSLADVHTGAHAIVDLEGRYKISDHFQLAVGADNLFDSYPDQIPLFNGAVALDNTGAAPWSSFSPFGFNGRRVYARISASW